MKNKILLLCLTLLLILSCTGCSTKKEAVKIGVSFGVGSATRWDSEKVLMENKAKELGIEIEVRLNRTDKPKTQEEDCIEMIDSGIDALILTARDVNHVSNIIAYAKEKNVPIVSYSRVIPKENVDLLVGYDNTRTGQKMGQYLSELVLNGDYILLRGDPNDDNARLLYEGAMQYIDPIRSQINVILDESVLGWDPALAKEMVKKAIESNNNQVDAILAPNDKIAGACADALSELGISDPVVITGMDAEIDAAKRIVTGTQSMTFFMDLRLLAHTAVEEACHLARKQPVSANADYDVQADKPIQANLIAAQLVTKENIDRVLIDSGYFTHDQIYTPTN